MSNTVNFKSLKRKEIRKTLGDGIEIYNPSTEKRKEIIAYIFDHAKGSDINISGTDIFIDMLPILTNITIPKDMSKESIEEILNDPDDLLIEVMDEVKLVLSTLTDRMLKNIEEANKMPKEQLEKLIKETSKGNKTPEELRIEALKKELEELESKSK